MKLLFINMRPIYHNTSSIIRMKGIIEGAHEIGHICDLLTMEADQNDYFYDEGFKEFVEKNISEYYVFKKIRSYQALKAQKNNNTAIKKVVKSIIVKIHKCFAIYDSLKVNLAQVRRLEIDYEQYDRIVSLSDPKSSHKIILDLVKRKKISNIEQKWIQCWGDPWLLDITRKGGLNGIFIKKEERKILNQAKKIVYTSPLTLNAQKEIYPEFGKKMISVNQAALKNSIKKENDITNEEIKLGYFGEYYKRVRNIEPLFNVSLENRYELFLVGSSDFELKDSAKIHIIGRIKSKEVEQIEENVNTIVCLCNRKGTQIPGKIYYYAGSNKPIILIIDGENKEWMKSYFSSFNRYIICNNDIYSIKEAVEIAKKDIQLKKKYVLDERFTNEYCAKKIFEE